MRKLIACGAGLVAVLALSVPGAFGGEAQTPGVTARSITIGGTFPLTGVAAAYAPIPLGMKAYFSYINARKGPDGKRGVYGRQIRWKYYDDAYNPANTIQLTRRLVEADAESVHVVTTRGETRTERVLSLVLLGDLVSLYVAVLRDTDPTPVEVIEELKAELARPDVASTG